MLFRSRPRGRLVLYEKIAGPGGSPPERWIDWGERAGGRLLRWEGNQFSPLERLLAAIVRALKPAAGRGAAPATPAPAAPALRDRHPGWYRLYAGVHGLSMRLSLPAEPLLERVLPGRWAEHAIFVFEHTDEDDEAPRLWAVVSDLDLVAAAQLDLDRQTAGATAVTPLVSVSSERPMAEAASLMAQHGIAHLAVTDPDTRRPIGVISTLDIAQAVAAGLDPAVTFPSA